MSDLNNLNLSFNIDGIENSSGNFVRRRERIKDGVSCYRILPPFGTNHGGSLFHKYTMHWGFIGNNGKERSVGCSYPHEGFCPVCAQVRQAEDELKRAEANGNDSSAKELKEYISKFRARRFWLYNAVTSDGRVVMLELGKTAHDALAKKILEACRRKVGAFDPVSLESGVWFEFTRTGKMFDTEYSVDFKKTSVTLEDGSVADKPDRSPLPPELLAQIREELKNSGEVQYGSLMQDIHTAHDPVTAIELKKMLNGGESAEQPAKAPAVSNKVGDIQSEIDRLNLLKATNV
jgi:hypothetical protein